MPNTIEKHQGLIATYPSNVIGTEHGTAVTRDGNSLTGAGGSAAVSLTGTIPAHVGAIIKAEPNAVVGAMGQVVGGRMENHVIDPGAVVVMQVLFPPFEDLTIDYPFVERQFPPYLSYGSSGGPGFRTSLFTVDNGIATAKAEWDQLRGRYDVVFDFATGVDVAEIEDFFYAMRGKGFGFRFKDWSDYQIVNQVVAVGDGVSRQFQLFKRYESGGYFYDRVIKKPIRESVRNVTVDGVEIFLGFDFYINNATGALIFDGPPPAGAIVEVGYLEFDIPVRFDTDELSIACVEHDQYEIQSIELIEIIV